ncbi:MAG: hypothetical protein ACRDT6_28370 [Micromonosporaceae bacterium]
MDELGWVLGVQDGVVTWRQASRGLTPDVVRGRVASGRWQRPCRGVLVAHNGPLTAPQREWVAVLAAGRGAVLAGLTAAALCGLRGYDSPAIHVLLPAHRTVDRRAVYGDLPVRLHRTSVLSSGDVLRGRPPHTTAARALIDAAQWATTEAQARAVLAAGVQQRLVTGGELREVLARLPRARRRRLMCETVADVTGGAHSIAELALVRLCREHGLPLPDQQHTRRDRQGRRRYLDAYWSRWRLHVEVDGGHHTEVRQWWADMSRQNDLWIAGDRILRFPSWLIRHHPTQVATHLRTALRSAGWHPRSCGSVGRTAR